MAAWIERDAGAVSVTGGYLNSLEAKVDFSWRFETFREMVEVVDATHAGEGSN